MIDVTQRLWGFCHTLRHEGVDYGDYIEQITYLLFLKMAEERGVELPKGCSWDDLRSRSGSELTDHYIDVLRTLGKQPAILGDIFSGAQSRFANPVSLKKLIALIDETHWTELGVDVKAEAFEGLLEKAASEGKKGAGQYFTPRILIDSIVGCIQPDPRKSKEFAISDPACGTGGFLVSSYEWLVEQTGGGGFDRATAKRVVGSTYYGQDLVERPRRLALMNLYLHGLEPHIGLGDSIYDPPARQRFDVVLTNPPFGTRGANQAPERDDFTISTSNKQLNFLQHVLTVLKPGGRAAVVVPDNCLFADQAGEVFKLLMEDCDLHTVLRLPNGTFTPYSPGTKTNVVFFTKGAPTERTWIYDARTNVPSITKKERPLEAGHFAEFEKCYGSDPNGRAPRRDTDSKEGRWRSFPISEVASRGYKLDSLRWLKDESGADLNAISDPDQLAGEAVAELEAAVNDIRSLLSSLEEYSDESPAEDGPPEGWTTAPLEQLSTGKASITYGVLKPGPVDPHGVPMLRVKDVNDGVVYDDDIYYISNELDSQYARTKLQGNEVLISVQGSVGRVAVVPESLAGANISRTLAVIPPAVPELADWIWLALQTPSVQIDLLGAVSGSTRDSLNLRDLRTVEILVPPLPEQGRIVARTRSLLESIEHLAGRLEKIAAFRGSEVDTTKLRLAVLEKAYRGQLVLSEAQLAQNEDREYETAEQLVARLAVEVATAA